MQSGKCKVWECRVSSVELKKVTGGQRRLREVTGGYGRLRSGKTENSGGRAGKKGRRHPTKRTEMSSVKCRRGSVEWKV